MEKKNEQIKKILQTFLAGRFSPDTEEQLQRWLIEESEQDEKTDASLEYWNSIEAKPGKQTYQALHQVKQRLGMTKSKVLSLRTRWIRVAAVILPFILLLGGYFYSHRAPQDTMILVSAGLGETRQVILPDNSEVWLNAGTSISYPEHFTEGTRTVRLQGEAYFSVRKLGRGQAFIVDAGELSVEVLGTEFNVKAYREEGQITTSLKQGKVQVTTGGKEKYILQPNDRLAYNTQTGQTDLSVITVAEDMDAWIEGDLIFTNSSMDEIVRSVERHFNVSLDASGLHQADPGERYTIKFIHKESVDEIVNILKELVE